MLLLEGGLRQVLLIGVRSIGFLARERNMTGNVGMFVDAVAAREMIQHPAGVAQFLDQVSNRVRHRAIAQRLENVPSFMRSCSNGRQGRCLSNRSRKAALREQRAILRQSKDAWDAEFYEFKPVARGSVYDLSTANGLGPQFKCSLTRLPVHEWSTVNGLGPRFKGSSTVALGSTSPLMPH